MKEVSGIVRRVDGRDLYRHSGGRALRICPTTRERSRRAGRAPSLALLAELCDAAADGLLLHAGARPAAALPPRCRSRSRIIARAARQGRQGLREYRLWLVRRRLLPRRLSNRQPRPGEHHACLFAGKGLPRKGRQGWLVRLCHRPGRAGHNPGDDLTKYPIAWDYIFQGTHTTTGGYVDTLKFNIGRVEAGKKTIMRIFSVSNVHGALGDNGQNYKNIAYILEGRGARIVHGCGAKAE